MTDAAGGDWRRRLAPLGVWCTTDGLDAAAAAVLAAEIEQLGYSALWVPEALGRDPFAHLAHLADHTTALVLATGIASIHHRHPGAMRQGADTIAEQTGGRFVLGLGVSHAPLVEGVRGLEYRRPLETMRSYVDAVEAAPYLGPAPAAPAPRVLAALGPKMLTLAGERADGALTYWGTPEHTSAARRALGDTGLLCVEQKVVLTSDAASARATAQQALGMYRTLPNYRNHWRRLGFSDADIDGGSDAFVDALVAWGEASAVARRLAAHRDAGADHVCIQPMTPGAALRADRAALATLAPAAQEVASP